MAKGRLRSDISPERSEPRERLQGVRLRRRKCVATAPSPSEMPFRAYPSSVLLTASTARAPSLRTLTRRRCALRRAVVTHFDGEGAVATHIDGEGAVVTHFGALSLVHAELAMASGECEELAGMKECLGVPLVFGAK